MTAPDAAFAPPITDKSLLRPELLHELFESTAEARKDAIAIVCGAESITYSKLEERANRLAHWLRGQGVRRGDCVGLLLPRSIELCAALLAILKTGAAYVPIDPSYPADRVGFILSDCKARALVTMRSLAERAAKFEGTFVLLGESQADIAAQSSARISCDETGTTPNDLCYVIYTSGSTGRPKGVEIEHRSVCHLVRAEGAIFQVRPEDRVYQGFSVAFDASVEEVWMAFFAGAMLVAATLEMEHAGPALSQMFVDAGVTVLSCVPTLLAMMEQDIPCLRLLILGGEACPPDLVRRWWKPGRRVVNTYGPTEATVIATYADCDPHRAVTIGRPLPNYFVQIVDEQMRALTAGVAGELCIGGVGLARGYVGRPDLTHEKFVVIELESLSSPDGDFATRLYKTGDLARWTADGEIEFLGRIDSQVKIRGFRVEMAEIESVLLQCPGVQAAAVALREDTPGNQQLVGYVVPRGAETLDEEGIRSKLRERLPAYMIPALIETIVELPTLPSGKVDRKNLSLPRQRVGSSAQEITGPRTRREKELVNAWDKLFAPAQVSVGDDFFLDLGGHSLLAARLVSELRTRSAWQEISMLDIYTYPTIEGLAGVFERRASGYGVPPLGGRPPEGFRDAEGSGALPPKGGTPYGERHDVRVAPFWQHFLCGAAQLVSVIFLLSFSAVQWVGPYLVFTLMVDEEYDFVTSICAAFASLVLLYPVMLCIPIAVKWLLIGRYKPGAYPLWGSYFFRWWFVTSIESAVPVGYLAGTPWLNIYLRLMGAKVGRNVHLDSDSFVIYDLLSIGDDSSINVDSNLLGYTIEDGWLKIGRIAIGERCFVGARSTLRHDTTMEDDSALEDLSLLPRGATIPRGETWLGSPSRATERRAPALREHKTEDHAEPELCAPRNSRPSRLRLIAFSFFYGVSLLIFPILVSAAIFPGIVVMNQLNYIDPYYWYLCLSPLVGVSFVVLLCLEIAALKWLLLGRVKPGRYALHSWYYLRKWFVDQTMDLSLDVIGPLYGSVYLTPWYRLLGAKVGNGAEISTASFISPDLLSIGDESFIADSVSLGAPRVRDGMVTIGNNNIGKRSFIGNSAMLPPGAVIGDECLIGCLSAPPANPADALRPGTSWMGSPAIFLPQRQHQSNFAAQTTFEPTPKLRVQRAVIEFVRVIMPSTAFIVLLSLMFSTLLLLRDYFDLWQTLLFFPALYIACGLAATAFTILAKWLLVWRYRPCEQPLWSTFVWRNELLNALHEHLAEPFLVGALTGTPFVCWYLRLLGAKIGRRVYLETTDFSEFDLARIGDHASLNADCTAQTHLFEDRVMKMSTIEIAAGAKVGAGTLVLYDTRMEQGAALGDLSLLMKGEVLPAGTSWEGIPARRVKNDQ
jgi:non-ribosomal peptide synthetase-like protein